ncbi:MAG: BrnT family toxin [Gallionellaceae bacterium]
MSDIVYDFQWDAVKSLTNADKHGVTFEQAATVFLDPLALFDEARSQDEGAGGRWGMMPVASLLQRILTILSARPAPVRACFPPGD